MQRRADGIRRIVAVQRQMRRVAERTLHDLRQQEHELQTSQNGVLAALACGIPIFLSLGPALSRRLTDTSSRSDVVAAAGARQAEVLREQVGRLRQAEHLERAVAGQVARAAARADLENLIDLTFHTTLTSIR